MMQVYSFKKNKGEKSIKDERRDNS